MFVSARLKYISVAYDYAVEVPAQYSLDRFPGSLPISNSSAAHESMRSKVSDIPEHIEQRSFFAVSIGILKARSVGISVCVVGWKNTTGALRKRC